MLVSCNQSGKSTANTTDVVAKHKAFVDTFFTHFNNHEWQKMADMYIEQPEMKDPLYGVNSIKTTRAEIVKKYTELAQAIPDIRDSVVHVYYAGAQNIVVEFQSSGTAPYGNKFMLPICTIFELQDGKISKDFTYYDNSNSQ